MEHILEIWPTGFPDELDIRIAREESRMVLRFCPEQLGEWGKIWEDQVRG